LPIVINLHDAADRVRLPATDDLRVITELTASSSTWRRSAKHAHDVALRQDAVDLALAHHQHRTDLAFTENLDRGRDFASGSTLRMLWPLVSRMETTVIGASVNPYRASTRPDFVRESSINSSTIPRRFRFRRR